MFSLYWTLDKPNLFQNGKQFLSVFESQLKMLQRVPWIPYCKCCLMDIKAPRRRTVGEPTTQAKNPRFSDQVICMYNITTVQILITHILLDILRRVLCVRLFSYVLYIHMFCLLFLVSTILLLYNRTLRQRQPFGLPSPVSPSQPGLHKLYKQYNNKKNINSTTIERIKTVPRSKEYKQQNNLKISNFEKFNHGPLHTSSDMEPFLYRLLHAGIFPSQTHNV